MRIFYIGMFVSLFALALIIFSFKMTKNMSETAPKIGIHYVALGDSYTVGAGVQEEERWPNILTKHLNDAGIQTTLVANPAVSGYTVRNTIELELDEVKSNKPDFITLLIGANDSFGQIDTATYQKELRELLDKLQTLMVNPKHIVLVTIPDYTISLAFAQYEKRETRNLIKEYNEIIKSEGKTRGLPVADIFPVSESMTTTADYVSDGLHPSSQGIAKWEKAIFPVVFELLK